MSRMRNLTTRSGAAALFLALVCLPGLAAAQDYRVEPLAEAPPEQVAAGVRETLAQDGVRIVGSEGPLLDLWLRSPLPLVAEKSRAPGVAYPALEEGTLAGVLRVHRRHGDYRKQQIPPGVYTLRYARHPVNGAHMGVSAYRDFLLLLQASDDSDPAVLPYGVVVALSSKASGTGHPSTWGLVEPEDDPETMPGLVHWGDEGLWMLYVKVSARSSGGSSHELSLVLVVAGHAPEA